MSLRGYIREHMLGILLWAAAGIVAGLFMRGLSLARDAVVYIELLFGAAFWVPHFANYARHARWWRETLCLVDDIEPAYRLPVVMTEPDFTDGELAVEVLERMARSMSDEVASHERARREYRDYLERWVHEIKTPIASAQLTAHNHPSSEMRLVARDLARIEARVMQALYYARSEAVEKDYFVEKTALRDIVDAALRRNAKELIGAHFSIDKPDLDEDVYTDPKWMGFVLDQIIQNAVKYRDGDSGTLRFAVEEARDSLDLLIEDGGIGISDEDIGRVFDKGFTGSTGRTHAASTGMGLYIAAQLLQKMHHSISAAHAAGGGFLLRIHFPKSHVEAFSD